MLVRFALIIFLSLSLTACQDSEKSARTLLNEAVKEWNAGNITTAESKFDAIEQKYIDTVVATESIRLRTELKEQYRKANDPLKAMQQNRGRFSRKVYRAINEYYQTLGDYPDSLNDLESGFSDALLSSCDYKKALFDYGFQLNCKAADKSVHQQIYAKKLERKQRKKQKKAVSAGDVKKANATWGDKLNPSKKIPSNGFNVFYINTNAPDEIVYQEHVPEISINYIYDKFHHIKSEDFGAYWVGRITVPEPTIKNFAISQSWSKTRLIVDGNIIYKGGSDKVIPVQLDKGHHLIEVEYVNNWHTTEFSVTLLDSVQKLSHTELKSALSNRVSGDYEVYFAALYESDAKDLSTTLNIQKNAKPVVLFLSSYSAVKWKISNPSNVNIKAIVYGSTSPGVTVTGDIKDSTLLLPIAKRIGSYDLSPSCSCHGAHFHCEHTGSALNTKKVIERITKHKLTGFSGKYSANVLKVPQIVINKDFVKQQVSNQKAVARLRKECQQKNDPDFEKMFES